MKHLKKYLPYFIIILVVISLVFAESIARKDVVIQSSGDGNNIPLVIIDAGHGGIDGGAVASDGTQEQYINLNIAFKMNEYLTSLGFRTLLTRSDDNSIHDNSAKTIREQKVSDIHNRLNIIESNPGCLFVSIHQNYFSEAQYSGTQVFYSPNNSNSSRLAQCIQSSVVNIMQPNNTRQIKESGASIYLLHHATQPAVLVECGFLSNAEETEKLKSNEYQQQLAEAICRGIIDYITTAEQSSESVE